MKQPDQRFHFFADHICERENYLILQFPWLSEKWSGPADTYRPWRVFRYASAMERMLLVDAFSEQEQAKRFVLRQLQVGAVKRPRGRPSKPCPPLPEKVSEEPPPD